MHNKGITLTRKELFDAVWSTPLSTLAGEYGISDVAIRKKCVKYKIPTPGRGYWAKKVAGKKVKTPKFSVVGYNPKINIRARQNNTLMKAVARNSKRDNKKSIPDKLRNPIEFVKDTQLALKDAYKDWDGYLWLKGARSLEVKVTRNSMNWALTVYDAILKELRKSGYKLQYGNGNHVNSFVAIKSGVAVSFYLYERYKRPKQEEQLSRNKPVGLLTLKITASYGFRRELSESKKNNFKDRLEDIIFAVENIVESRLARDERWRIDNLKRRREDRIRGLSTKRKQKFLAMKRLEQIRFDDLKKEAHIHNECNVIRQYLEDLKKSWSHVGELSPDQKQRLKEAEILINRYDPLMPEYKKLQDFPVYDDMMKELWSEIQKKIDDWMNIP